MDTELKDRVSDRYIAAGEAVFEEIHRIQRTIEPTLMRLNYQLLQKDEFQRTLSDLIGDPVDDSVTVLPPFYTDFGKHITFGTGIFINRGVMFTDLGGIGIEDHVLIGPFAKLLTVNHPTDPNERRGLITKPIRVKRNAWIGAGATILPGVTIGENAIVAANATVTKDVPDNVTVAGTPARIVGAIE
ncbi:acetyltransferase [Exiguobacterium sp. SH31]|uniref:DapH/DapD/GlmU-related protein n=1 Tax=Exiguobacterium sp. SH31 TaxID=1843183 RepID=UPI0008B27AAA|nr:DapH/DapD/GlmU-related protein [Exiguobacterium sp. SH31]OGX79631.1 acetyltransferase [Exiguobacterium sp. SH31]